MTMLRCKMCGGNVLPGESSSYGTCDSCGTTMTLPRVSEERVVNLFNRANHYRQQNEFDKAQATYESILGEDGTNAEAYWGVVLSKFGIEYVEDPGSHKRIPTCHRVQSVSVLNDLDYQKALENAADDYSRSLYEKEGELIAQIQQNILDIANKEEPFDVFICYKETDINGNRTVDSTIAQDIFYQLDREGLKVFFARITLEDKLGSAYEPHIFAALNSAKVMLVVGTKPEHFNAVWVKNEWSRYLDLVKGNPKKILIPAYKDMDAYDLPDEFSHLQSQDMSKIGFMQDLIRGIQKITSADSKSASATKSQTIVAGGSLQVEPLLERAFLCLEDKDWNKADTLLEQVLNLDPKNAQAYIGKLMVALRVSKESRIQENAEPIAGFADYQKALRFANSEQKKLWEGYNQVILERKEKERLEAERLAEEEQIEAEILAEKARVDAKRLAEENRIKAVRQAEEDRIQYKKRMSRAIKFGLLGIAIIIVAVFSKNTYDKVKKHQEDERIRVEEAQYIEEQYNNGVKYMDEGDYYYASSCFNNATGYKDANKKIRELQLMLSVKISDAGSVFVQVQKDGTVVATGDNAGGQCNVSDWSDIVAISASFVNTVGLKKDGTVVAVGYNEFGECDISDWSDIVAILTNRGITVGLKKDGTVVATGSNTTGECNVSDWSDIVAISNNGSNTFGLKKDGTVVIAGRIDNKELEKVLDWRDIVAISVQEDYVVGLKKDGTVVSSDNTPISDWSDIEALSTVTQNTVGLKKDGTVISTKTNLSGGEYDVSGWNDIVAISAQYDFTIGLKKDGTVVATGNNKYGQCDVSDFYDIVAIATSEFATFGIKSDGTIVTAGSSILDNN